MQIYIHTHTQFLESDKVSQYNLSIPLQKAFMIDNHAIFQTIMRENNGLKTQAEDWALILQNLGISC